METLRLYEVGDTQETAIFINYDDAFKEMSELAKDIGGDADDYLQSEKDYESLEEVAAIVAYGSCVNEDTEFLQRLLDIYMPPIEDLEQSCAPWLVCEELEEKKSKAFEKFLEIVNLSISNPAIKQLSHADLEDIIDSRNKPHKRYRT